MIILQPDVHVWRDFMLETNREQSVGENDGVG